MSTQRLVYACSWPSCIHSLKLETTQMFTYRRTDIVMYPHHKILLSSKKWNEVLAHTMWINLRITRFSVRSQTQKSIYCLMQFLWNCRKGKTNLSKADPWWHGGGVWERGLIAKGQREAGRVMKIFFSWLQCWLLYIYKKIFWSIHLKLVLSLFINNTSIKTGIRKINQIVMNCGEK